MFYCKAYLRQKAKPHYKQQEVFHGSSPLCRGYLQYNIIACLDADCLHGDHQGKKKAIKNIAPRSKTY